MLEFSSDIGQILPEILIVEFASFGTNNIGDGPVIQLSQREGSEEPRWTSDNKRIVYRSGQQWMEVEVLNSKTLEDSRPRVVIKGDYVNISNRLQIALAQQRSS